MLIPGRRIFQAGGTAHTKALGQSGLGVFSHTQEVNVAGAEGSGSR